MKDRKSQLREVRIGHRNGLEGRDYFGCFCGGEMAIVNSDESVRDRAA